MILKSSTGRFQNMGRTPAWNLLARSLGIRFCTHQSKSIILGENIRKIIKEKDNGKVFSNEKSIDYCAEVWASKGMDLYLLFLKIYFHSLVCVCVSLWAYVMCLWVTGGQKAWNFLQLELQASLRCLMWVLGTELLSSGKRIWARNCTSISPVPGFTLKLKINTPDFWNLCIAIKDF